MSTNRPPVVFVDVDDTLVRSFGSKQIQLEHVLEAVRHLQSEGVELYCWSSGGAAYSREVCERLGIAGAFAAFLPKPDVMLDDLKPSAWRNLIVWHPSEVRGRTTSELLTRSPKPS